MTALGNAARLVGETQVVVPATGTFTWMWVLVALPLAGFLLLILGGRRTNAWGHWVGVATVGAAFALGAVLFAQMLGLPGEERSHLQALWSWVVAGGFRADVALLLDPLSMVFVLLITGVGGLIHVYSVGYMAEDPERRKFFAYLNLFVASMLLLVLADNYLLLYVGWEGVGLASYLLIGFWNRRRAYATAANKAFIMNRVGDLGLSIAIMLMFATFGDITIRGVADTAPDASRTTVTVICLLLLLAATGKSAQIPLQAWLGDAMAGPTPVSALIHAATMVTAGVYLIVRSHGLFDLSPTGRAFVAAVGAITLIFGAIVASNKDDIKKSLAGSTMSQIGYMVLAAGLGPLGYVFAIAHLLAHGCFKAQLFLGAGSVMHAMDDETNMRRFGALRAVIPITFATFICGYLGIIGIPPFSAFFTKDKIVEAAFDSGGWQGWVLGTTALVGAGLTAYYMTRMVAMTFFGEKRWEDDVHPHESPQIMLAPMYVLAFLSLVMGWFLIGGNRLGRWLEPVLGPEPDVQHVLPPALLSALAVVFVLIGAFVAWRQFGQRPVPVAAPAAGPLVELARHDLGQDAVNEAVFMRPGQYLTRWLVWFDNRVVDGVVNGTAAAIGGLSARLRRLQTGFARSYALSILAGAAALVVAVVLVRI